MTCSPVTYICSTIPMRGGTHLPDIYIFKPVFLDGTLACYLVSIAHHADVGGMVAGGNGLRRYRDLSRRYSGSRRSSSMPPASQTAAVFELMRANVRVPRLVLGDLRAQLSACHVGERRVKTLFARYGHEELQARFSALLDYTERLARQAIADLPDGEYAFTDYIDDDGFDPGADPHCRHGEGAWRLDDGGFCRYVAAGARRHQFTDTVYTLGGLRLRAQSHGGGNPEQRGVLPPDRGDRAGEFGHQSQHARAGGGAGSHRLPHRQCRDGRAGPNWRRSAYRPARWGATPV